MIKNPYKRFINDNSYESHVESWVRPFDIEVFDDIIKRHKPTSIIELGSFLGYSIINMLDVSRSIGMYPSAICIDTWLGGSDHLIDQDINSDNLFYKYFDISEGTSKAFDQFCINIVNAEYDGQVNPVPNTTDNAYTYLKHSGVESDIIYVDASHLESQVYTDICNYHTLLSKKGVIFGHDINWESVRNAVEKFCNNNSFDYRTHHDKFWEII
jgi:hypothetical protein